MKDGKLSEFLKTPKGKLTAACGALLISWIFLFQQLSGDLSGWIPSEAKSIAVQKDLVKLRRENEDLQKQVRKSVRQKELYAQKIRQAWDLEKDGEVENVLPKLVDQAARKAELKLQNVGSVRTSRINNDLFFAELDVSANVSLETVLKFVLAVSEQKPQIAWKRFQLNVMMRRQNASRSVNQASAKKTLQDTETRILFSGTLRVICCDKAPDGKGKSK